MRSWDELKDKLILSIVFGIAIVAALAIYADLPQMVSALRQFQWNLIPGILALTLINYTLRFVKWDWYLKIIGAKSVPRADSLIIFVSGFTMIMTPGKLGEFFKAYLLNQADGVPIGRAAPIILAERLTDGLAMVLLAAAGLVIYQYGWPIVASVVIVMSILIAVVQYRTLSLRLLAWGEGLPLVSRFAVSLREFYESMYELLNWTNLLLAVGLGVFSWGAECAALYLVLRGLGFASGPVLLLQSAFAFASSTILGAVSLLPGGLGITDGSLTGLLLLLLDTTRQLAVTATLLIRFFTLWFAVSLGLITLFAFRDRFQRESEAPVPADPTRTS